MLYEEKFVGIVRKKISNDSEWKGAVDADRIMFKEFMKEVREDIREINKNILGIFSQLDPPDFIDGKSPLSLTEQGQKVSKELNAASWAKKDC